jgi:diguanylate cyclase (GGDEF)-like protein/PAS domain S-box-containing protein
LAADLTLQWATPSIESVLGWSQEQVLGTPIVELVHPEDRQTILAWGTDVVAGKNMAPFEVRVATDDGHYRWMSVNTRPTTGSDGVLTGVIIGLRDADDEVHARAQLARSEQMFRLAMDGAPQGMAVIGLHLAFLQVNAALCQMLGRDEEWMLSHTIRDVTHPADLEEDLSDRDELLRGSAASKVRECRWVRADGTSVWVVHSTGLLRDEAHMPLFYVSHVQDNTVTHEVRAELVYRAGHDSLTGLMNRDQMQDRISAVLDHQPRRGGSPVLLYCDLDRFKGINDTYGHAAGDFVLKMTAERITACLRSDDWVARLGGDEFVVVLPEIHDLPSASGVAQKIRKSVAQPLQLGQTDMSITISIGIALAPVNIEAHRLLRNADAALYVAKHAGRDQISVYEDDEFGD